MSRGLPSLTALLGLLAVAGYQNKDKIAEMLGGSGPAGAGSGRRPGGQEGGMGGGLGGLLSSLGGGGSTAGHQGGGLGGGMGGGLGGLLSSLGGASAGSMLGGGLGELVSRFNQAGHRDTVDSWVGSGPNREIAPHQLEGAIGPDVLDDLTRQTGLSREEILSRLSRELPRAVDQYTPHGRVPRDEDFFRP